VRPFQQSKIFESAIIDFLAPDGMAAISRASFWHCQLAARSAGARSLWESHQQRALSSGSASLAHDWIFLSLGSHTVRMPSALLQSWLKNLAQALNEKWNFIDAKVPLRGDRS